MYIFCVHKRIYMCILDVCKCMCVYVCACVRVTLREYLLNYGLARVHIMQV